MNLVGPLSKLAKAGATAVKTAPFYSALDEALVNLARPKGTGAEFLRELSKTPGVKPAEIADRKLAKAFEAKGKMTKEEAIKLAGEYPPPKLREEITNDLTDKQLAQRADDIAQSWGYRDYDDLTAQFQIEVDQRLERMLNQYGDYQLPGGQNYREIKMKLPSFSKEDAMKMMELEANQRRTDPDFWRNSGDAYRLRQLQEKKAAMGDPYLSSHWKGEPNVLAHMRVSDRVGPDGQKILHVEEIQSDWHQEGRKKGYVSDELGPKVSDEEYKLGAELQNRQRRGEPLSQDELASLNDIMGRHTRSYSGGKVPDAPFKKNWHELAMKRLLNYAADNGYDSIAITPGAEQAKRYDLSKHIDELIYSDDGSLYASKGGNKVFNERVTPEKLADYVGKDAAEKLMSAQPNEVGSRVIGGLDLQVGGEGMKGFYDQMLPSYLNQFGKKHGAQVGKIPVQTGTEMSRGASGSDMIPTHQPVYQDLHHFPITPQLREELTTKGTPLYQQIGIPTAGAGAASQLPEPEEGLAGGGIINSLAKTEALAKLAKLREQMAPRAETVQNLMKMDESKYLRDVTPDVLTKEYIEQEVARMKARADASQPEVKKAKGGKVKITANRDTMFMELSNKKLKRK